MIERFNKRRYKSKPACRHTKNCTRVFLVTFPKLDTTSPLAGDGLTVGHPNSGTLLSEKKEGIHDTPSVVEDPQTH